MVRFCLIIGFLFISCESIKNKMLQDGTTKVPIDKKFFDKKYRNKYEIVLSKMIDPNSVYVESFYLDSNAKLFDSKKGHNSFIGVLKFYRNGCLNNFIVNKDSLHSLPKLNPLIRGYRGICYKNERDTIIEIILPVDEVYNLGKKKYFLKTRQDTLVLTDNQTLFIYKI